MTDREYWVHIRASLIKQEKALKEQRDGILQQIAAIERKWNIYKAAAEIAIQPSDSIAGIMNAQPQEKR
jgi:hypothetical protein